MIQTILNKMQFHEKLKTRKVIDRWLSILILMSLSRKDISCFYSFFLVFLI